MQACAFHRYRDANPEPEDEALSKSQGMVGDIMDTILAHPAHAAAAATMCGGIYGAYSRFTHPQKVDHCTESHDTNYPDEPPHAYFVPFTDDVFVKVPMQLQ